MAVACDIVCNIRLRHIRIRTIKLKNMALLLRTVARQGLCSSRSQFGILYRHAVPMGTTAKEEMNKFWTKNTRLNRPVSPHISIYQWSVPMVLSISHRGTGVGLSSGPHRSYNGKDTEERNRWNHFQKLVNDSNMTAKQNPPNIKELEIRMTERISAFALAALVLPENYPYYLDLIHSMSFGPQFLAFTKFALAFPVAFHTFNGVRHLIWDVGKGFKLPEVYRSGYVVIALTVLTSIGLAAM